MANYFNSIPLRVQLEQLGKCEFMEQSEFVNGVKKLAGKKIVLINCVCYKLLIIQSNGIIMKVQSKKTTILGNFHGFLFSGITAIKYKNLIPASYPCFDIGNFACYFKASVRY